MTHEGYQGTRVLVTQGEFDEYQSFINAVWCVLKELIKDRKVLMASDSLQW